MDIPFDWVPRHPVGCAVAEIKKEQKGKKKKKQSWVSAKRRVKSGEVGADMIIIFIILRINRYKTIEN